MATTTSMHLKQQPAPCFGQRKNKNLTPALSSLLSSTTISSRSRRRLSSSSTASSSLLAFPKKNVAPQLTTPSSLIHKRLGSHDSSASDTSSLESYSSSTRSRKRSAAATTTSTATAAPTRQPARDYFEPTTNVALSLHRRGPPGQHRNDLEDPLLEEQAQDGQLFSIDYAVGTQPVRNALDMPVYSEVPSRFSKPLWQLLQEEDEDEDEDDDEDDISSSSFSSVSSSYSSIFRSASVSSTSPTSGSLNSITMPRGVTKRKSVSVMRSGSKIISMPTTDIKSVDDFSHPLSTVPSSDDLSSMATTTGNSDNESTSSPPLKHTLTLVNAISASFKALKAAAMGFSQSHQALLTSTVTHDVFTFSPRSTDERAPNTTGFRGISATDNEDAASGSDDGSDDGNTRSNSRTLRRSRISSQSAIAVPHHHNHTADSGSSSPSSEPTHPAAASASASAVRLATFSIQEHVLPPPPRLRDIRENPDFLRVYALEGLMRRNGKLDPGFEGRACVALMPRADKIPDRSVDTSRFPKYKRANVCSAGAVAGLGGNATLADRKSVPLRWVGTSLDQA